MTRWPIAPLLFVLSCASCTGADPDTDTDPTAETDDSDEVPPLACAYDDMEGSWAGSVVQGRIEFTLQTTVQPADLGEELGLVDILTTNLDPQLECELRWECTGDVQLDWRVVRSFAVSGVCVDSFVFLRLEADDTLTYESGPSEFDERTAKGTLTRVE